MPPDRVLARAPAPSGEAPSSILCPHERNLEVGRPIRFRIEPATIHVASAPEKQVAGEVDEVVFLEVLTLDQSKWRERLAKDHLLLTNLPRRVPISGDFVEQIRKRLDERRHRVGLVGHEVDLL